MSRITAPKLSSFDPATCTKAFSVPEDVPAGSTIVVCIERDVIKVDIVTPDPID